VTRDRPSRPTPDATRDWTFDRGVRPGAKASLQGVQYRGHRGRGCGLQHTQEFSPQHPGDLKIRLDVVAAYRLHSTVGDDLGLLEHPAPNLEPGDVVQLPDGREALVTPRVETIGGPLAALLEVVSTGARA
jgi:hypothetical protein